MKCRGGWGWDGNALPIGTEAQAGGVGRRVRLEKHNEGGETKCAPRRPGVEAADWEDPACWRALGEPAARGCPHPSPALHTKDPASC